ncbi:hypothetical protein DPMN_086450 [Dreissena polymorpha]|uniref:Uncharacterized protein n=1 Tax=Dreissena polymorpha TaxID=45954 RepID=A0A9D4KR16_DREPO|nr:hypothetical protein DPMN_086450 [Dreissena polymorpha]
MCLRTEIQNGSSVHRWLVFMSSYLVVVINIGFAFSVGSLFVIIVRRFNTTRAEAATIQSTLGGVKNTLKFGIRADNFSSQAPGVSEQPSVKTKQTATTGHHKEINRINVSVVTVPDIRVAYDNSKFKIDDIASDRADNQTRTETSSNAGVNGNRQTVECLNNNVLTGPKSTDLTLRSSMHCLFRNRVFMVFVAGLAFSLPIINILTVFIVDLYQDRGSTKKEASFGLIALNVCGGLGRLSPGFIMKIPGMTTLGVPIIVCVLLVLEEATANKLSCLTAALLNIKCGIHGNYETYRMVKLEAKEDQQEIKN